MNQIKGRVQHLIASLVLALLLAGCSKPKLAPLAEDAVILAFGDSLTYGTGVAKQHSYPAQLQSLVSQTIVNAGKPGEISADGLRRLPELLDKYQPQLLLLCHGGNDILRKHDLKQTKRNISAMVEMAQARGIQVVLIGVPELALFGGTHEFYQEIADEYQLAFLPDVLNELERSPKYKVDSIHLNQQGNQLFAEAIHELLQQEGAL